MHTTPALLKNLFLVTLALCVLIPTPAHAWRGFVWDEWLTIAKATKPDVTSPQAGHHELLPLLKPGFDSEKAIATTAEWEAKRAAITTVLQAFLGSPEAVERPQPKATEAGREDMGGYERIHLRIAGEPNDDIPAYLLRPKKLATPKSPVMIVLHQTQAPGKQEACGMVGDTNMAFAKELVERGIICIVPDAIGFGERIPEGGEPYDNAIELFRRHPKWSFFGKMNWDVARVIDYLETLPEVDTARIGVIGHSHGAYGSIMAAVFEPRIKLVVSSCGFTTLRTDPRPDRWSHLTALFPQLGFYVDDIDQAPFDWHEIIACIAPRPYFNWSTLNDDIFPETDNLADVYEQVRGVYALYGKGELFTGKLAPGKHRFPPEAREEAYTWIEKRFQGM
ncbi:MAG: alpha/beta fold hydrolase [Candidatus Hydrogenedentales bacterium]|jgi:dienelactone hydrolase